MHRPGEAGGAREAHGAREAGRAGKVTEAHLRRARPLPGRARGPKLLRHILKQLQDPPQLTSRVGAARILRQGCLRALHRLRVEGLRPVVAAAPAARSEEHAQRRLPLLEPSLPLVEGRLQLRHRLLRPGQLPLLRFEPRVELGEDKLKVGHELGRLLRHHRLALRHHRLPSPERCLHRRLPSIFRRGLCCAPSLVPRVKPSHGRHRWGLLHPIRLRPIRL